MTLSMSSGPRAPGAAAAPHRAGTRGRARPALAFQLGQRAAATLAELARGRGLLAAIRAELALEPGERVLSAETGREGECALVATDRAVYHRDPAPGGADGGWSRLGWEQVAQVGWDAAGGQLIVIGLSCPARDASASTVAGGPAGAASSRVVVPLRQRGTMPELAAERIAHTRLGRWQLHVAGRRRAVIEARRRPVTGELLWSVTPDADGQGDVRQRDQGQADPDIRAHAERAIARLSAEFGALPQPGTGLSLR